MTSRNLPLTETLLGTADIAQPITLEQLWAKAESYGRLSVIASSYSRRSNTYSAHINFQTISNIALQARSYFDLPLTEALRQAIAKAESIRGQFK